MKIIDFSKHGNVVRFYLGNDSLKEWYGDDWDDIPYEHNAGEVYNQFVAGYVDIAFPFDCLVLEPKDDWHNEGNSEWSKEDMKNELVPCIIVVPETLTDYDDTFEHYVGMKEVYRIYFGDAESSLYKIVNAIKIGSKNFDLNKKE